MCPWCGQHRGTPLQMFWLCPHLATLEDPHQAIALSQDLVPQATSPAGLACLWYRGILPLACVEPAPPCMEARVTLVGAQPLRWPSGIYYGDGSGGAHSSHKTLRRCGVGVACLHADQSFRFGAYLALPGRVQTVLRAEIYAFLVIILFAEPLAQLTILTDSLLPFVHCSP